MSGFSALSGDRRAVESTDLVIRGGSLGDGPVRLALEKAEAALGRPGLSIAAGPYVSHRELLEASTIPHHIVCVTTVARLQACGFHDIVQTRGIPHHTVWFPEDWRTSDDLLRFTQAFDGPLSIKTL